MYKKQAPIYSAVLIIYLGIITLIRWQLKWKISLLWLGGFAGLILYSLDHVVYLFWQNPTTATAREFKKLLAQKKFKESLKLLGNTYQERKNLIGHSVIFQIVLVALMLFSFSSSNSLFGKGLIIGLFLYSLINQGILLVNGKSISCWFWQLRIKTSQKAEAFYFLTLVILLFFFSRMLI